jgi:hypothetical protein
VRGFNFELKLRQYCFSKNETTAINIGTIAARRGKFTTLLTASQTHASLMLSASGRRQPMRKATVQTAVATALGLTAVGGPAEAAVIIDIFQSGDNVLATTSGTVDLTDLSFLVSQPPESPQVIASNGILLLGEGSTDLYTGIGGPGSFGSGGIVFASSASGDAVGVSNYPVLIVPENYASGSPLSGTTTWDGQKIASLGLTPGTYDYTWGSGSHADSLTINITIPEPSTWAMMLIGFAGLGFAGYLRARAGHATPPVEG